MKDIDRERRDYFGFDSELSAPKWPLINRVAVFMIGIAGLTSALKTRGVTRKLLALFGFASLVRATTNQSVTNLIGWIANPSVRLNRTIQINAAREDVYDFLSHFSNYPQFMSYVQEVEVNEKGNLRWTVRGPGRFPFHWNTQVTVMIKNQTIHWINSSNTMIRNSGTIELSDLLNSGTKVQIELSYVPPAGALGYALIHILGFDPREKIDDDLQTLKTIIENRYQNDLLLSEANYP